MKKVKLQERRENEYWKSGEKVFIYTEKIKLSSKLPIHKKCFSASYFNKKGKLYAHQYSVDEDSPEWKQISNAIGLSSKDRFIERKGERKRESKSS